MKILAAVVMTFLASLVTSAQSHHPTALAPSATNNCQYSYTDGAGEIVSSFCALFDNFDNIARIKAFQHGTGNSQVLLESDAQASQLSDVSLRARKGGALSAELDVNGNTGLIVTKSKGQSVTVTGPGFFHVTGNGMFTGDVRTINQGSGLIMRATDGPNCYRVTVNNDGVLSTKLVGCI